MRLYLLAECNWYSSINKSEYFDHNGDYADERS